MIVHIMGFTSHSRVVFLTDANTDVMSLASRRQTAVPEYVCLIKPTLLTARSQAQKAFTSYFLQQLYRLALQRFRTVHRICQQNSLNWS